MKKTLLILLGGLLLCINIFANEDIGQDSEPTGNESGTIQIYK